ncbi:hypothetical protein FB451DRAFT_1163832 [Mycena latifolia]|nr:hypothetical protein FB451DRAFT_1163832 [Mycena latifolia]
MYMTNPDVKTGTPYSAAPRKFNPRNVEGKLNIDVCPGGHVRRKFVKGNNNKGRNTRRSGVLGLAEYHATNVVGGRKNGARKEKGLRIHIPRTGGESSPDLPTLIRTMRLAQGWGVRRTPPVLLPCLRGKRKRSEDEASERGPALRALVGAESGRGTRIRRASEARGQAGGDADVADKSEGGDERAQAQRQFPRIKTAAGVADGVPVRQWCAVEAYEGERAQMRATPPEFLRLGDMRREPKRCMRGSPRQSPSTTPTDARAERGMERAQREEGRLWAEWREERGSPSERCCGRAEQVILKSVTRHRLRESTWPVRTSTRRSRRSAVYLLAPRPTIGNSRRTHKFSSKYTRTRAHPTMRDSSTPEMPEHTCARSQIYHNPPSIHGVI